MKLRVMNKLSKFLFVITSVVSILILPVLIFLIFFTDVYISKLLFISLIIGWGLLAYTEEKVSGYILVEATKELETLKKELDEALFVIPKLKNYYETLTMNDLKLLLKSEKIPYSNNCSKKELVELVRKHEGIKNG